MHHATAQRPLATLPQATPRATPTPGQRDRPRPAPLPRRVQRPDLGSEFRATVSRTNRDPAAEAVDTRSAREARHVGQQFAAFVCQT